MGRRTSKPFNSLWNKTWNEKIDMTVIDRDFLTDLFFDSETNKLEFVLKHYHREPKITRYVSSNYVKTPIYEDYSERTKVIKKFSRVINPIKFVNEDILKLDLKKDFILEIISKIGITPEWRKKEVKLANIESKIETLKKDFRNFNQQKRLYSFQKTNYQENPSNFWLRFSFGFFTFFLSFLGFVSKKQAQENRKLNKKNKKLNQQHKIKVDQENEKLLVLIEENNKAITNEIEQLKNKLQEVKNKKIEIVTVDTKGWIDLRIASNFSYSNLKDKKGIYIIWNKTKNKYYVGQSKNIGRRLLQHFKNGDVKNVLFAKDWYLGDQFMYKYYFCQTKDELDSLEKRYIEEYDAFANGYNSTGGNI